MDLQTDTRGFLDATDNKRRILRPVSKKAEMMVTVKAGNLNYLGLKIPHATANNTRKNTTWEELYG